MPNLFNVGAFIILLRETLEAVIVVGVLLNFISKAVSHQPVLERRLRLQVWSGVAVGLALSILLGAAFSVVYYVLKQDVFGSFEAIWEGVFKTIAAVLLTLMGFSMLKAASFEEKWERKIKATGIEEHAQAELENERNNSNTLEWKSFLRFNRRKPSKPKDSDTTIEEGNHIINRPYSIFILSFSVIIREGLESVVFLTGVGQGEPLSLIIPGIVGIVAGLLIGKLLHSGLGNLQLRKFLLVSTVVLFVLAAGLIANAAHEFEEVGYMQAALRAGANSEDYPESTPILWDVSECCSQETNAFFQLMNAIIGWRSEATVATVVSYFAYWILIAFVGLFLRKRSTGSASTSEEGA